MTTRFSTHRTTSRVTCPADQALSMASRRQFLTRILLAAGAAPLVGTSRAAEPPQRSRERAGVELITPEAKAAIQKGLLFLARQQITQGNLRGAFGTQSYSAGVAVCGLAGLAFLSSGSSPGRGPHGKQIDRCIDFLCSCTDGKGFVSSPTIGGMDNMYGHGFATLFMAEAYGMSSHVDADEKLGKKVRAAINLIISTQNNAGGWRYQPIKSDADLSITICQIMALRAARDAGINVPIGTRDKCLDYIKKSQTANGTFTYTIGGGHGSLALTAAGVVALNSAGIYDGPEIDKALRFLWAHKPDQRAAGSYEFYSQYYAAQAMWHAGGDYWSGWYPAIREKLIKQQTGSGSWNDQMAGDEFGTAIACIILQLPYNMVPIFGES